MQPHSWQVFSGSSLMWRSAWYCFLHSHLPSALVREHPCARRPLGFQLAAWTGLLPWRSLTKGLLGSSGWFSVAHEATASPLHLLSTHASNTFRFCHLPGRVSSWQKHAQLCWIQERELPPEEELRSHSP